MTFPYFPLGYTYPTITADKARERGISAGSLLATAKWNERLARGAAKERRLRQARELRAVAAQLSAGNDNVERREAA